MRSISCTTNAAAIYGRIVNNAFDNGGNDAFDAGDTIARVQADAGDAIVCTFTNVENATVRYTKVTDPAADAQDFVFTTTGSGLTGDTLDTDPGSAGTPNTHIDTLSASQLGSKDIAETPVSGWTLTNIS